MKESESLDIELALLEEDIMSSCRALNNQLEKRTQLRGRLNRARRLEREELQNGKQ